MKKSTKREKRKRRKQRKQAVERLIQNTERRLVGKREETWVIAGGGDRTITLPPPTPGRRLVIKTDPAGQLPPGTKITVQPGRTVRQTSFLASGTEPMTEEQFEKYFAGVFGSKP